MDDANRYTKMGYAGNWEPSHIIPTAVALSTKKVRRGDTLQMHGSGHAANPDLAVRCQAAGAYVGGLEDLDYYIGNQVDPSL